MSHPHPEVTSQHVLYEFIAYLDYDKEHGPISDETEKHDKSSTTSTVSDHYASHSLSIAHREALFVTRMTDPLMSNYTFWSDTDFRPSGIFLRILSLA